MIRKGALLRSINDGDYLRPFLCEKRFLEMMPCVDNHNQMFCISRKKLSHYAKQQGISYRVILLGFRVGAMKDCQAPAGTITATKGENPPQAMAEKGAICAHVCAVEQKEDLLTS